MLHGGGRLDRRPLAKPARVRPDHERHQRGRHEDRRQRDHRRSPGKILLISLAAIHRGIAAPRPGSHPEHADCPHHSGQGQHAAERARRRGSELDPQLMGAARHGHLDETERCARRDRGRPAVHCCAPAGEVEAADADGGRGRQIEPVGISERACGRAHGRAARRQRGAVEGIERPAGAQRLGQIGRRIRIGDPGGQILVGAGGGARAARQLIARDVSQRRLGHIRKGAGEQIGRDAERDQDRAAPAARPCAAVPG